MTALVAFQDGCATGEIEIQRFVHQVTTALLVRTKLLHAQLDSGNQIMELTPNLNVKFVRRVTNAMSQESMI